MKYKQRNESTRVSKHSCCGGVRGDIICREDDCSTVRMVLVLLTVISEQGNYVLFSIIYGTSQ